MDEMNKNEMNKNEKLVHSLWDISHKMRRLHDGKASQSRILVILQERKTMTQRELTEHLHVQPGSASEILSKMEQTGLIVRVPNTTDRRTTDLFLTEKGKILAQEAVEKRKALYEKMFLSLTAEEQDTLFSLLEKLQADWDTRFDCLADGCHQKCHHEKETKCHHEKETED